MIVYKKMDNNPLCECI